MQKEATYATKLKSLRRDLMEPKAICGSSVVCAARKTTSWTLGELFQRYCTHWEKHSPSRPSKQQIFTLNATPGAYKVRVLAADNHWNTKPWAMELIHRWNGRNSGKSKGYYGIKKEREWIPIFGFVLKLTIQWGRVELLEDSLEADGTKTKVLHAYIQFLNTLSSQVDFL